ncbi:Paraquat-inducible protein A [Seminavis robusta]|uniref:Paraquat-inducible protein A n=1 Tax=Seminavis robusta TaxID=568900 RepID=A0A9N8E832_9STRA|nr:Paraquat-inducible protein A [Seminavis robusta]|eukprot:Sro757_g197920.1 Paraquat-inducible protein A (1554) ;mRNA; r:10960-15781
MIVKRVRVHRVLALLVLTVLLWSSKEALATASSSSPLVELQESLQDPNCDDSSTNTKYDPLACWLWKTKVSIPDLEFHRRILLIPTTVTVHDLSCTNFVVETLESSYTPSDRNHSSTTNNSNWKNPSIRLVVKGIAASCQGKYHATGGFSGDLQVTANSDGNDDKTALQFTWEFVSSFHLPNATHTIQQQHHQQNQYWMPIALNTQQCQASLQVADLSFHGSISADIVNGFSGMISNKVTQELNGDVLCPQIKDAVDPVVTQSLLTADRALNKYLPHNNNSVDLVQSQQQQPARLLQSTSTLKSNAIDFATDLPKFYHTLQHLNNFLGCFYQTGTAHNCDSFINREFKNIASALLEGVKDQIKIPVPAGMHKIRFDLPQYGKVLVDVQELHVVGLETLQSLSILAPQDTDGNNAQQQFQTQLQSSKNKGGGGGGVNITANINITISSIPGGLIHGDPLNEVFHVNFNMSTLDAMAMVTLALDKDQFQNIQIARVTDAFPAIFFPGDQNKQDNAAKNRKCLFDSIQTLKVNDMTLRAILGSATFVPHFMASNFGRGRRLSRLVSRQLEEDLDDMLNHVLMLVLQEYQPLLSDATFGLVRTTLLSQLNNWLDRQLHNVTNGHDNNNNKSLVYHHDDDTRALLSVDTKDGTHDARALLSVDTKDDGYCQTSSDDGADQNLANFSQLILLDKLNDLINQPSTLDSINQAIETLAKNIEAKYNPSSFWAQPWIRELARLAKGIPGVSLRLKEIRLDNFGAVEHIDLLSPLSDGLHLKNGVSYAMDHGMPRLHLSLDVDYCPRNINGILNLTAKLEDVYLDAGSILHFDMTRLRQLTLSHLFSNGHCAFTPFRKHEFYNKNNSNSRIGNLLANVSAEVTGGSKFQNFTVATDTIAYPSAEKLVASIVAWVLYTLKDILNSAASSSFQQAESYCTGGQVFGYDKDPPILNDGFHDELLLPVVGIFVGLFAIAQILYFCGKRYCSVRDDANESNEVTGDMSQSLLSHTNGTSTTISDMEEKNDNEAQGETLLQSTVISAFARQAVPILIIGTIILLVSSNISSGATVDLHLSWKERSLSLPALFTFSLYNTAKDMWQAKIYPLFFLVLTLSGMWPYTKLLLMLVSWITPANYLKPSTRGTLLLALDALGKFALVDTYLFVLMMVAFRYHLDVSDTLSVDVFVSPETGFYTFLGATCFSLLMGHFLVYCHRLSEMRLLKPRNARRFRKSICQHKYYVGDDTGQQMQLSKCFKTAIVLTALGATVLLAVGITIKCFRFEIGGLAGDFLGDDRITYYSLMSLGTSLRKSVQDPSSMGILLLEVIYFFYAVATPFACLGLLLVLFLVPMRLETQRFFVVLAEIANAWSAVEVFVISIIASLLEISTFASFIVGHRCDLIKKIIHDRFASALDDATDATCFTVRSSVEPNVWVLIMGALLNSIVVGVLLRLIHCSVNERIQAEMVSSVEPTIDDALRSDDSSKPRTIINFLSSGCCRSLLFDARSATIRTVGYTPQSDDTFSVLREVNWEEESTVNTREPRPHNSPIPHNSPSQDVMETLRDAFGD